MKLPIYTELSNFTTRKNGQKVKADLSIALIINRLSDPVETINSVYNFMTQTEVITEMIILNTDKEGYNYDKLLSNFPVLRILLPQNPITLSEAFHLIIEESLSQHVMFISDDFKMKALNLDVMKMYLSETHYGAVIPQIVDKDGNIVPNIIKGNIQNGFLTTFSLNIKGTSISTLFPKYFCFILNRNMFVQRQIQLHSYEQERFILLETGYRIWQEGFFIFQVSSFKVQLTGESSEDIINNPDDFDYLLFNLLNLSDLSSKRGQFFFRILKLFFSLKFKRLGIFLKAHRVANKLKDKNYTPPVSDQTIFKSLNKDIE